MTICIGGICCSQNGFAKNAIAVADRMITAGDTEFEQLAFSKIEKLTENCVAVTAGSALAHTELFKATRAKFAGTPRPPIIDLVQEMKNNYVRLRTLRAEERHFKPLGLTVASFLQNQRSLDSTLVLRLSHQLEEATYGGGIGLQIVVAGVDTAGAHIHCIFDPGSSECFDAIGYCSIGSGERHADSALIINDYNVALSVKKSLYLMFEAKKRAEMAPGVGRKYTDVSIISDSAIRSLTVQDIQELQKVYDKHNEVELSCRQEMDDLIEKLPFSMGEESKHDKTPRTRKP